jgi:branched-chain amino acid transport system ATP-binding protein
MTSTGERDKEQHMDLLRSEKISMYFGGVKAVDHVDLSLARGQIMGIIGPNGSGKTTYFNVLTGIYKPTSGKFYLQDTDITSWQPHKVAQAGIARTFQNIRLFKNSSVIENVLVGEHTRLKATMWGALARNKAQQADERAARERAENLLEFVQLSGKIEEFAANLAYGEQRRLEIARALAIEPKLLLLDEPTAGMNLSEAVQIMDIIHQIRELGITILLIEHNMQVMMETAEYIVAFAAGKKIAEGTPKEIQYNKQVIQAYLGEEE